ncbi:uncharacterized protein LOC125323932 isoform X2 [Corvus hawaiiensis]|uniref:uncharacterized protein LOC125323932 isoform X2 n=1 Tax=Corvus hawaiiensis TaxID=134902 RepID=UPI0020191C67|nr:uncharacterized protein LOC125323932 isoform X2 [Corvus hawaiiensis]
MSRGSRLALAVSALLSAAIVAAVHMQQRRELELHQLPNAVLCVSLQGQRAARSPRGCEVALSEILSVRTRKRRTFAC